MVKKNRPSFFYLFLSISISIIFVGVSFSKIYNSFELKMLDARFRIRGPISTRTDIATVDIDVRALQEEGRFQDWSRDKHERIISFAHEHGVKMVAFDIYFPERSTRYILDNDLNLLDEDEFNSETVRGLMRDYDHGMAVAMIEAGNVYLAQSFKPLSEGQYDARPRTPSQDRALELLEPYYQEHADTIGHFLFGFYDIEPPIPDFISASKGIAYAQAVADDDGVIRRYPLVAQYDGRLFPSMALLMACDYFGVDFRAVKVVPGDYVAIPRGGTTGNSGEALRIPISKEGHMLVNWAGDWEDDFEHFPYSLLKEFSEAEHPNYVLSGIKSLIRENPLLVQNPKALLEKAKALKLGPEQIVRDAFSKVLMAKSVETLLEDNLSMEVKDFFESQGISLDKVAPGMIRFFQEIKTNLMIEKLLAEDQQLSYDTLLVRLKLEGGAQLKRNFTIISNLLRTQGTATHQHPLYFYSSPTEYSLQGKAIAPFEFQNKILFYGLTATGTHDLNPMPFNPRYPMVGLHANALNTILSQNFIRRTPKVYEIAIMLIIGIILGLLVPRFQAVVGAVSTVSLWGMYASLNVIAFSRSAVWIDIIGPSLIFLFGYLTITIYNYISEEKDKKFLHETFKAYLSPDLIDKMYEEKQSPQLGGEERILTAMFTDIQSFSTIAEELGSPTKLVELLNDYLTAMTDILLEHDGTLDKYEGDAIIAFFGAPVPMEDHAEKAFQTALAMQSRLVDLRKNWSSEGERWPQIAKDMLMRIGLNSGPIVTGNMGSRTRMNYTMMGDAVNLASRLESIAKQYGVFTACSGETLNLAGESSFVTRLIDRIRVVGKSEPVSMFELVGLRGEVNSEVKEMLDMFEEAQGYYFQQDWNQAIELFKKCLNLEPYENHPSTSVTPSRMFIDRCEEFMEVPPEGEWDGVYTATSK
ncbi:MAG: CHASE2 domain-containing protein [Candidatus Neomarinimicrobiota bacterium]